MSTGREQPDDLDAMLEASRELRARYRAESVEEPPAAVDDALRAQARRAVGAGPRPASRSFLQRWRVPLSIAAVLVMSVSMVLTVTREGRHLPQAEVPPSAQTGAPAQPAAAPAPQVEERGPSVSKPNERATVSEPMRFEKSLPDELESRPAEPFPKAAPPSQTAQAEQGNAPVSAKEAPRSPEERTSQFAAKAAPPAAMSPQANAAAGAPAAPPPAAASAPPPAAAPVPLPSERPAVPTQAQRARPPMAVAPLAEESGEARLAKRKAESDQRAADSTSVNVSEGPGSLLQNHATAGMQARADAAAWESDPKAWLAHIEQLARTQRADEARESLKAFRKRYPAYPLPPEFPVREP